MQKKNKNQPSACRLKQPIKMQLNTLKQRQVFSAKL